MPVARLSTCNGQPDHRDHEDEAQNGDNDADYDARNIGALPPPQAPTAPRAPVVVFVAVLVLLPPARRRPVGVVFVPVPLSTARTRAVVIVFVIEFPIFRHGSHTNPGKGRKTTQPAPHINLLKQVRSTTRVTR